MGYSPGFDTADPDGSPSNRRNLADSGGSLSHTAAGTCSTAVWGVSFVKAVPPSQPLTPSVGSTPEGVSLTPGLIITTAPGTEKTQTRSRGSPSTRGHAGSVSLHAHIPGDIASFTTQHGAEGAVLTTTSQCEFRSLAYL